MSGVLSQAVANLQAAEQQIQSLTGLPASAAQIQASSAPVIASTVSQVQAMQAAVNEFVNQAIPQLNAIKEMAEKSQPVDQIKPAMDVVQQESNNLKTLVDNASAQIKQASNEVMGYFNQLAQVNSDLTGQITSLQGQLGDAQSEEAAAQKKYYYLLALGPFGLIGLSVALGLYLKWKSDVNDLQSQISALNSQIAVLNSMKLASQQLGTDFQGIVDKISGVQNTVEFVASDLLEIDSDLETGTSLPVITLKVTAAITEVTTLGIDAS